MGATIAPSPAALTESNLHGATLTLTLDNTTFAAGAQGAGTGAFALVSTIPGLTIAQVSGVASGGTTATLTLGFTGDFRGQPTVAVRVPAATHQGTGALTSNAVAVTADAGVTVSESGLSLDEDPGTGGSAHEGTYTVVLDSPPTGCALVRIDVASDDTGVTVSPAMLTFRRSAMTQLWNAPQTVTVTAGQDDDGADIAATVSHSVGLGCSAAGYLPGMALPSVSVAVSDDEAPDFVFDADPSSPATDEAGPLALVEDDAADASKEYTVRLATQPTQDVTVTLTSTDTGAVAVGNTTDAPDKSVTVSGTASDSLDLAQNPSPVTLTITDDDAAPGVTLSLNPASIGESGGTSTVSAALSHPSSAATTVTVTAVSGAFTVPSGAAGYIVIPAGGTTAATATDTVTVTAQANVFTVASGAGGTIVVAAGATTTDTATITAVDNAVDAADNPVTVAATAGNGHGVGTVTGASLTLTDDDVAAIVTSPQTTTSRVRTSEDGSTAAVAVTLATEPTGDVRIDVASSDTAQGTVSPAMLTFTATNWNTAQTVTLTGVDDSPGAADGSQTYTVSLTVDTANTADANYDALSAVTLHAVNADDELGLDVGTVSGPVTEAGGTATFTVRLVADPALATQASQAVTVSVSSRDAGEGRVSPSSTNRPVRSHGPIQLETTPGRETRPGEAVSENMTKMYPDSYTALRTVGESSQK